jgi:hypothetical protein
VAAPFWTTTQDHLCAGVLASDAARCSAHVLASYGSDTDGSITATALNNGALSQRARSRCARCSARRLFTHVLAFLFLLWAIHRTGRAVAYLHVLLKKRQKASLCLDSCCFRVRRRPAAWADWGHSSRRQPKWFSLSGRTIARAEQRLHSRFCCCK